MLGSNTVEKWLVGRSKVVDSLLDGLLVYEVFVEYLLHDFPVEFRESSEVKLQLFFFLNRYSFGLDLKALETVFELLN